MDETKLLEMILEHNMSKEEAKAWKVAIMYIELSQKYFPDYKHYTVYSAKDPRRTSLFKHCFKLVRECDKYLKPEEYRLYLTAQFQIMKNIDYGTGNTAFIQPNCIVGPKAWKRWLLWKEKFNKLELPQEPVKVNIGDKLILELEASKRFLESKFKKLTRQNIIDALEGRSLFRWVALGEVSGYYLVLSPIVKSWISSRKVDLLEAFALDMAYYRNEVTPEAEAYFKQEFAYEFGI